MIRADVRFEAPEEDFQPAAEMEDGCGTGRGDAVGGRDLIEANVGKGRL